MSVLGVVPDEVWAALVPVLILVGNELRWRQQQRTAKRVERQVDLLPELLDLARENRADGDADTDRGGTS